MKKHLMLSLGVQGFGEATLGLQLGSQLQAAGDEVFFISHASNERLFSQSHQYLSFVDASSPFLPFYIENCLSTFKASSIILSDYFVASHFFHRFSQDLEALTKHGLPIFAIDTWDSSQWTGQIDLLDDAAGTVTLWPDKVKCICPVPFVTPHIQSQFYGCLPSTNPARNRHDTRDRLGLGSAAKLVLFCTALWQHPEYETQFEAVRRAGSSLPLLLGDYISRLGESVHLLHVGPRPFSLDAKLGSRYHWLAPLPPSEFDALLASVDLFLTANLSATTISKAMVLNVPVVVLQNSFKAGSVEEAQEAMPYPYSIRLRKWLEEAVPLYPFAMWPLGYHRFLTRLLQNGPYLQALDAIELLDEQRVEAILSGLLFQKSARREMAERQTAYVGQVRLLPSGADIIHAELN